MNDATRVKAAESAGALPSAPNRGAKSSKLWLWFVALFALQFAVWGAWITLASRNKVAEVPLATAGGQK